MISDKFKYLFVHIPKNAGSAVEKALLSLEDKEYSQGWYDNKCRPSLDEATRDSYMLGGSYAHMTLPVFAKQKQLKGKFNEYFKFTFVRNPWDRFVSEYEYCRKGGVDGQLSCPYSFEEFCNKFVEGSLVTCTKETGEIYEEHVMLQSKFIDETIDFVGRVENLQSDFNRVCRRLGVEEVELFRVNATFRNRNYREYYTDETRKLIGKFYRWDAVQFSYEF